MDSQLVTLQNVTEELGRDGEESFMLNQHFGIPKNKSKLKSINSNNYY